MDKYTNEMRNIMKASNHIQLYGSLFCTSASLLVFL